MIMMTMIMIVVVMIITTTTTTTMMMVMMMTTIDDDRSDDDGSPMCISSLLYPKTSSILYSSVFPTNTALTEIARVLFAHLYTETARRSED